METTRDLQLIEVDRLIPYLNNARTHSKDQINKIRASFREFGFINPVIIDEELNVIAGHGRLLAAKEEKIEKVPCVFVNHLSESQKKAYILADNRMALDAGWDEDLLKVEIEALQEDDFDALLTGFTEEELAKFFYDDEETEEDDFDVEKELENPQITKAGDLWILGNHRLYCGDSTNELAYTKLMDGKKANLVVTDPPYNIDFEGPLGKIKNDNQKDDRFYEFLLKAFLLTEQNMTDDSSIYVFHADSEGLSFRRAFNDAGFYLSETCIWKKQSHILGSAPYQWQHEPCLFGWKKNGKHKWYADRKQTTIWEFSKIRKNTDHPTMKPIPLVSYPIKNSSMENCIVLDPFGGSGSTLIACEQNNRNCFTAEIDEKYCDVIVNRYIKQKGSSEDVYLIRGDKRIAFDELNNEV